MAPHCIPNYSAIRVTLMQLDHWMPFRNLGQQSTPLDICVVKAADKNKLMCAHLRDLKRQSHRTMTPEILRLVSMFTDETAGADVPRSSSRRKATTDMRQVRAPTPSHGAHLDDSQQTTPSTPVPVENEASGKEQREGI